MYVSNMKSTTGCPSNKCCFSTLVWIWELNSLGQVSLSFVPEINHARLSSSITTHETRKNSSLRYTARCGGKMPRFAYFRLAESLQTIYIAGETRLRPSGRDGRVAMGVIKRSITRTGSHHIGPEIASTWSSMSSRNSLGTSTTAPFSRTRFQRSAWTTLQHLRTSSRYLPSSFSHLCHSPKTRSLLSFKIHSIDVKGLLVFPKSPGARESPNTRD